MYVENLIGEKVAYVNILNLILSNIELKSKTVDILLEVGVSIANTKSRA